MCDQSVNQHGTEWSQDYNGATHNRGSVGTGYDPGAPYPSRLTPRSVHPTSCPGEYEPSLLVGQCAIVTAMPTGTIVSTGLRFIVCPQTTEAIVPPMGPLSTAVSPRIAWVSGGGCSAWSDQGRIEGCRTGGGPNLSAPFPKLDLEYSRLTAQNV